MSREKESDDPPLRDNSRPRPTSNKKRVLATFRFHPDSTLTFAGELSCELLGREGKSWIFGLSVATALVVCSKPPSDYVARAEARLEVLVQPMGAVSLSIL